MELVINDLEALTGKLIRGDITPIVYMLLKDSDYKKDLITLLTKEETKDVSEQNKDTTTNKEVDSRVSFEEWISIVGKPVSL